VFGFIVICVLVAIVTIGLFPQLYVAMMTLCGVGVAIGLFVVVKNLVALHKYRKSHPKLAHVAQGRWSQPVYDPKAFEAQVAGIFRSYGYHVVETPYQGDHGVDLKVFKDNEYAVVQCKRHAKPIGEPVIRDFFGALQHEGADHGFVVTTSRFTESAHRWAKGKRILLVDGVGLQKMLDETAGKRSGVK
jgi:restriction system protein